MSRCRSCGADIIWIKMASGKAMPCDADPIPYCEVFSGGMKLVTKNGEIVQGAYDGTSENVAYQSHFATCPDANKFRKRK